MSDPKRVRLSRAKGWRKPDGVIVVSRPSSWGNPFRVGDPHPEVDRVIRDRAEAVRLYRRALDVGQITYRSSERKRHLLTAFVVRQALAGHDLACWCPLDEPCHADVLLEIANSGGES